MRERDKEKKIGWRQNKRRVKKRHACMWANQILQGERYS